MPDIVTRPPCPKCGNTKVWLMGKTIRNGRKVPSYRCTGEGCGYVYTETTKPRSKNQSKPEPENTQIKKSDTTKSKLSKLGKVL